MLGNDAASQFEVAAQILQLFLDRLHPFHEFGRADSGTRLGRNRKNPSWFKDAVVNLVQA